MENYGSPSVIQFSKFSNRLVPGAAIVIAKAARSAYWRACGADLSPSKHDFTTEVRDRLGLLSRKTYDSSAAWCSDAKVIIEGRRSSRATASLSLTSPSLHSIDIAEGEQAVIRRRACDEQLREDTSICFAILNVLDHCTQHQESRSQISTFSESLFVGNIVSYSIAYAHVHNVHHYKRNLHPRPHRAV